MHQTEACVQGRALLTLVSTFSDEDVRAGSLARVFPAFTDCDWLDFLVVVDWFALFGIFAYGFAYSFVLFTDGDAVFLIQVNECLCLPVSLQSSVGPVMCVFFIFSVLNNIAKT